MEFRIADTFTEALARLPAAEQKAAKVSVVDYQLDPSSPGLQFHRVDRSRDPNFWSMRVNRDLRIIVHKTAASILLAYVDHHDRAYAWAERRRIEAHPRTGAVQIVELRERVEETAPLLFAATPTVEPASEAKAVRPALPLFADLSEDDLLSVGVPADWIAPVLEATEERFYDLSTHLPGEAAEALLEYAATGVLRFETPLLKSFPALEAVQPAAPPEPTAEAFAHPDSLRRFRTVENVDELRAALDAPWERWAVFLHPSQREVVEHAYGGPARVAGSAGTGKTVVALHRAARMAQSADNRVLLTTFSEPLAEALADKVRLLVADGSKTASRIRVASWRGVADELHELAFGRRVRAAAPDQVAAALTAAAEDLGVNDFSARFISAEFAHVVDAWQVETPEAYAAVPRLGRKSRLGDRQRERLWPVFAEGRARLARAGLTTWPQVFGILAAHHADRADKPFTHVVVDEAQDLGVAELRLLAALTPANGDALFFAGDLGQRIFQPPFSWLALGVDVRGRSTTLKVNYRTSHQIREAADRLLPSAVRDVDGREEVRRGTISVFDGPAPVVVRVESEAHEQARAGEFIRAAVSGGVHAEEIGVFVRSRAQLARARAAVEQCGHACTEGRGDGVRIGVMHLAKGLEFKAVLVLACDDEVLPLQARVASAVDEADLDEVYETERQLFYVACTRARDRLFVSGVEPASVFLDDLG